MIFIFYFHYFHYFLLFGILLDYLFLFVHLFCFSNSFLLILLTQ